MKVVILTSSQYGTASHHLQYLIESKACDISMVILNQNIIPDKYKYLRKKILKIFRIGILGAINGIRMRKWFIESTKTKSIEDICSQNNIPFFKTPSINSPTTIKLFEEADPQLGLSLGNGHIGQKVFSIPKYGMINIHHEILPAYQNAQSVIWQIYNMSIKTGFTIHKIDKHIDTGDILYQKEVPIHFSQTLSKTVANTYSLLLDASAKGLIYVIKNFNTIQGQTKSQSNGRSYTTPTILQYIKIYSNFKKLSRRQSARQSEIKAS